MVDGLLSPVLLEPIELAPSVVGLAVDDPPFSVWEILFRVEDGEADVTGMEDGDDEEIS